jgi:hypothetical protein
MPTCTCDDTTQTITKTCFNCATTAVVQMTSLDCYFNCKKHKRVPICGTKPFLCDTCTANNWVAHGGEGGAIYIENTVTKERKKDY